MPRSSNAPPPSSSALMRCCGSSESFWVWSAMSVRTSPSAPSAMSSRMRTMWGRYLVHIASSASSPRSAARSAISCASRAFTVNGFSTSTCLPASSTRRALPACSGCGVDTYTTSTSGSATSAS